MLTGANMYSQNDTSNTVQRDTRCQLAAIGLNTLLGRLEGWVLHVLCSV